MNTPWFFLSYASISDEYDDQVRVFFSDLVKAVRVSGQLKKNEYSDEDVGFLAVQMPAGTDWPAELCNKLNSCCVLVCLYSAAYFKSEHCGREFQIFRSRLDEYIRARGIPPQAQIIPVLWFVPKDFDERLLPTALKRIQYKLSGFDEATNQRGIYYYLSIHGNKGSNYHEYVNDLADRITSAAGLDPPLSPLANDFDFGTAENAFADYSTASTKSDEALEHSGDLQTKPAQIDFFAEAISPTKIKLRWKSDAASKMKIERRQGSKGEFRSVPEVNVGATEYVDSRLRPSTTYVYKISAADNGYISNATGTATTRPIPVHWYIIGGAALVIMASLAFAFRCKFPGICKNEVATSTPLPAAQPVIETQPWPDNFDRDPTAGSNVWLKSGEWTYAKDKWDTTKGSQGNPENNRALVVQGTKPGLTTKIFDDFKATFTISYLSGDKAGWFLRAEEEARAGYQFVLLKPAHMKDGFTLTVTAVGSPNSVIKTNTCTVTLPDEYGQKPDDYIDVEVTAKNGQFTYLFTPRVPVPFSEPRPALKVPMTKACSNPITDEGKYLRSGRIGFFALDGTQFKVEKIAVTPLKQN